MKDAERELTALDAVLKLHDAMARIGYIKTYNEIIDRVVMASAAISEDPDPALEESVDLMTEHINDEIKAIEQSISSILNSSIIKESPPSQ